MRAVIAMRACLGIAAVLAGFVAPAESHACSGSACVPGSIYPPAGRVPANAVELVWSPPRQFSGNDAGVKPAPRLFRAEGDGGAGQALPVTVGAPAANGEVRITPTITIAAGTRLVIERDESCSASGTVRSTLEVGESATKPTALGRLRATMGRRPVTVPVTSGECTKPFDASYADLTLELGDAARPYADLFRYQLRVDDDPRDVSYGALIAPWLAHPYANVEPLPHGSELIFTLCESGLTYPSGVAPGVHRVRMVGRLPDGTELSSEEVSVDLRCDGGAVDAGARDDSRDAGRADGAVSGTVPRGIDSGLSASPRDAAPVADAGRADAGRQEVADDTNTDDAEDGAGCALAPARGAPRGAALWLITTLLLVLRRGRSRRALCRGAART